LALPERLWVAALVLCHQHTIDFHTLIGRFFAIEFACVLVTGIDRLCDDGRRIGIADAFDSFRCALDLVRDRRVTPGT
jgi:hypothetical protein